MKNGVFFCIYVNLGRVGGCCSPMREKHTGMDHKNN